MRVARRVGALLLICLAAVSAAAQQGVNSLTGIIQDASDAAIPAVVVTMTNLDRNQATSASSDERGRFLFPFDLIAYRARHRSF
jgi:hypothetical protein